jgi:glutamate/aspartate transport system substrate-binding protein
LTGRRAAGRFASGAGVLLGASLALMAATGGTAHGAANSTLQKIRSSGTVTLAYRESSIPFSYLATDKTPVGYSIDLCLKVVDALRRELKAPDLRVQWLPVTAATRIAAIVEGKADLECGNTTNTAARRKQVAFTVTHYFAGGRLLVRTNSGIHSFQDLRGKRVITTRGSTHALRLADAQKKGLLNASVTEAKDPDAAFAVLQKGEADAFLYDDIVLYSMRATSPDPSQLAVVGDFTSVEPLSIMFRRDDAEFKRLVDSTLSRVMIDGDGERIYERWFLSPIPPKGVNLDVPLSALMRDQLRFPTDKVGDELGG